MPTLTASPTEYAFDSEDEAVRKQARINVKMSRMLLRNGQYSESFLLLRDALDDPDCIDEVMKLALVYFPDPYNMIALLEDANSTAYRYALQDLKPGQLDQDTDFRDGKPIWAKPTIRRWMRTKAAVIQVSVMMRDYNRAITEGTWMLKIDPSDNLGLRYSFGSILLLSGRVKDALSFALEWINAKAQTPLRGGCAYSPTRSTPLSQATLLFHRLRLPWADACEHFLTAALAAYHLWGDCGLARQCLRMGAELCPTILARILARCPKPDGPWVGHANSCPEAIRSYLWIAQDMWTSPKVLEWAGADKEVMAFLLQPCARPGCTRRETTLFQFKHCGHCHARIYCGRKCQRQDSFFHGARCTYVYYSYKGLEKKQSVPIQKLTSRVHDMLIDCPSHVEVTAPNLHTDLYPEDEEYEYEDEDQYQYEDDVF